ncbi:transcriptional regulator [Thraustotheca clavata]|uniref:Transcriptional regulator n=1 Tax=Thraustotheca clavata TaxID=74557 RepID=A0A1V9YTF4_9STRA|nr:transcriptional regulator [Thraustotheca clavata]
MYTPSAFREDNMERIHEIITSHPFATLIVPQLDNKPPLISHVPLLHDKEANALHGHVAKVNAIGKIDGLLKAVAIFHGPNAYVSPSWYETKKLNGKVVPTWNYISVHVHGELSIIKEREWIIENVSSLSGIHERDMEHPWKTTDAPKEYIDLLAKSIVGIQVKIDSIESQFKLSQNKKAGDFFGVMNGMHSTPKHDGGKEIAAWMERVQDEIQK